MAWPRRFQTTLPSDLGAGAGARAWLADCLSCVPEESRAVIPDVVLAFGELFTNCVRHAYGPGVAGRIEVALAVTSDEICLSVQDYGRTIDASHIAAPDLSRANEGGYGIFLVRTLADQVEFEAPGGVGNRVTLRRRLDAASAARPGAAAGRASRC
jgi:anti-sigma regulatory factor (Ser/Thr protein kinase)